MYISSHFCWFLLTTPRGNWKQLQWRSSSAQRRKPPLKHSETLRCQVPCYDFFRHQKLLATFMENMADFTERIASLLRMRWIPWIRWILGLWVGKLVSSYLARKRTKRDSMTLHDELLTHQPWNWQCSFKWCSMVNMTSVYQREFVSHASWHDHPWPAEFILHSGTGFSNALTSHLWIDGTMW